MTDLRKEITHPYNKITYASIPYATIIETISPNENVARIHCGNEIYIYYRRTNYLEKWISKLREISQDGNGSRGFNKINGGM